MRPYQEFQDADGNYTPEFEAFYAAVGEAGCKNYDCNQVAMAIKAGWTPQQAANTFTAWNGEDSDEIQFDPFDRDMSMNG